MLGSTAVIALVVVGAAFAVGGLAPSEPATTSSTYAAETDVNTADTDTTLAAPDAATLEDEGDPTTILEDEETAPPGDEGDTTDSSYAHPDNFGGTISSLRHDGDHTPAAVVKGKDVPGWTKKHPVTSTTAPAEGNTATDEGDATPAEG